MKRYVLFAAAAVLSACATMSADQCATADWSAIGLKDGANGENMSMADRREKDCAKASIVMDRVAYMASREQGLAQYCTPQNAYEIGKVFGRYDGVCANHNETEFLYAHSQGTALAGYKAAIADARSKLSDATVEVASISETIDGYSNGSIEFEAEGHNEKVLAIWSKRKYLSTVAIPYWQAEIKKGERVIDRYDQRGQYGGFDPAELAASQPNGPRPYTGPTEQDAREMVAEVFRDAAAKLKRTSAN
jgi:hypothetical protein